MTTAPGRAPTAGEWGVAASGRHLLRRGEPWFLLGDTAWELPRRLTPPEAGEYLRVRAAQGFNTVFAVAISEFGGAAAPTLDGHRPFHDLDPDRPNEPYWARLDTIVALAGDHGLVFGMLPCWGSTWHDDHGGAPFFSPERIRRFHAWIARRYARADVVWVLGGDRPLTTPLHHEVVEAAAAGVRSVVGDRRLITFHPSGARSSSDFLPDAEWLDFHLAQSGHTGWGTPNYQLIAQDRDLAPAKPTMDGEPNYEGGNVMTADWQPVPGCFFDDSAVRRAAYHAVFYGAAGHVYGAHGVWQMNDPARPAPAGSSAPHWRAALTMPGARQMGHLARLHRELDLFGWEPAGRLIRSNRGFLGSHIAVLADRSAPRFAVYVPEGRHVDLDPGRLPAEAAGDWTARWWDPRTGAWLPGAEVVPADRVRRARERGRGVRLETAFPGTDGVLLLEP
jgi:hypothetical protein